MDAAGRLTGERWLDDTGVGVQAREYQYDPAGNRTRMIADDVATYYGYDTLNQLTATAATDGGSTGYTYTPDGAPAWRQGPVVTRPWSQDQPRAGGDRR